MAFRPDGRRFFVGHADRVGVLWGWDGTKAWIVTNLVHSGAPWGALFGADDRWLLTVTDTGQITAWDATTGLAHRHFAASGKPVAALGPDGNAVAFVTPVTSDHELVHLVRVDDGTEVAPPLHCTGGAQQVAWSPEGGRLGVINGAYAQVYSLWEGRDHPIHLLHGTRVTALRFSPDGLRLLTVTAEGSARLWDAHTGAPLTSSFPHPQHEWMTCFSPDGRWLATSHPDGQARLWDLRPGLPLGWTDEADVIRGLAGYESLAALRLRAWFQPEKSEILRSLASRTRELGTPEALLAADFLDQRATQPPVRQEPPRTLQTR